MPEDWASQWKDFSFEELAFEVFSLYISPSEIPSADLKDPSNEGTQHSVPQELHPL